MLTERLALYATVYPGVERYLSTWYQSVRAQTDQNFDVWIGIDGLDVEALTAAIHAHPSVTWVLGQEGDSPAQIRQRAIEQIVQEYPAVVLSDSDDTLAPTRVEAARAALHKSDVCGCTMRIIDEEARDLGLVFHPPEAIKLHSILARYNVFGLSNTAYRTKLLARCLPLPIDCVLIDWFLATFAWTLGASFHFDPICRMNYRQHANNVAHILPPFTSQQVIVATKQVLFHYAIVLKDIPALQVQHRYELEVAKNRAKLFYDAIEESTEKLSRYVNALNRLPEHHIWWDIVAHPELEEIWRN